MPVFNVGTAEKGKGTHEAGTALGEGQVESDSLEGKSAAVTFPGGLKTGLFERRAADEQELVGRVHELQLL